MKNLIFVWICLILAIPCQARTITVDDDGPADFNNIQAGINDANDGDIIIVADGTYTGNGNRDIDFLGKAITVRSTDPNDPNIVAATIIDCEGTESEPHRGFKFHNGEDANSILSGLTITNGYGPSESLGYWVRSIGGGIFCNGSSPTIANCKISNNIGHKYGGGIYCWSKSLPTISNCTIAGNSAAYKGGGISCVYDSNATIINCTINDNESGGIYCSECSPTIDNCKIEFNSAEYDSGGGIYCDYYASPSITNCTISGNSAEYGFGGGIYCDDSNPTIVNCTLSSNLAGEGGGIHCWGELSPIITNCTIVDNTATLYGGGGISCDGSNPTITNCIIIANSAKFAPWGGGILCSHGRPELINCVIVGNTAVESGGGIFCAPESDPNFTNCTIAGNIAHTEGGGIWCGHNSNLTIIDCILWSNEAPDGLQMYLWSHSNASIGYSDIPGGPNDVYISPDSTLNWGVGNIDADPCFVEPGYWDANDLWVEGDYHLVESSPCIDAGDPNYVAGPNETDLDGKPRVVDGDNDGNSVVDMGAYERMPEPAELIAQLLEEVGGLELPSGIENGLEAKLNAALRALEDENENNDAAAVNTLEAFINAVEAQRGKKIPEAEADELIAAAQEIIDLLSAE